MMNLSVVPVSPHLGARIAEPGIDLAKPIGDDVVSAIRKAWLEANGLLILPNQTLTPEQQIAFSRRFGKLVRRDDHVLHPAVPHPEISVVSNKVKDGRKLGRISGVFWHSDGTYKNPTVAATLLYGIEVPPCGGDTMFASMYCAYDTLSDRMKQFLEGLEAVHTYDGSYGIATPLEKRIEHPSRARPVVLTHPETGRKALNVNQGFTTEIVGFTPPESAAILGFLFQHSTRPEIIYRHQWHEKDLVIWDNRCLIHYAVNDYDGISERYMHRTQVADQGP